MITLLGIVSPQSCIELGLQPWNEHQKGEFYAFVDYSPADYEIGSLFITGSVRVKLTKVIDQFGHDLKKIEQGWQTICMFEAEFIMPNAIKKLHVTDDFALTGTVAELMFLRKD